MTASRSAPGQRITRRVTATHHDLTGMPRLVPLVPATLGAVLVFLGLGRLTHQAIGIGSYLAVAGGTLGIALALVAATWRGHRMGVRALHLVLAGCVLVAAADTVAYTQASGRTDRGAELLLLAAGCGLLLVERPWYLGGMGTVTLAWAALAAGAPATRGYFVAGLVVSIGVGHSVRHARLAALCEVGRLRARLAEVETMAEDTGPGHGTTPPGAVIDPGTGLPDWRGLLLIGARLLAIARRESAPLGAAVVRIEGYREVLERHGTARAEELAAHLGAALGSAVRATDAVGRWAPDELAVIAHGQGAGLDLLRTRLAAVVAPGCPLSAEQWPRRLRLGHAVTEPWESGDVAAVLIAAGRALGDPIDFAEHVVTAPEARGTHEIAGDGARQAQRESL